MDYADERPVIRLRWDYIKGEEPTNLALSPGSALRDASTGDLLTWRVLPDESGRWTNDIPYVDVPVRLYVAEAKVYHSLDGQVTESLRKVEGVELCTGVMSLSWGPGPTREASSTCDQAHGDEVTVLAYSDDEDSWTDPGFEGEIGITVGITKGPEQAGNYFLVAEPVEGEPLAEPFRRGDSWQVAEDQCITDAQTQETTCLESWRKGFGVLGGMFLDEDWQPVEGRIGLLADQSLYLRAHLASQLPEETLSIQLHEDGGLVSEDNLLLTRVAGEDIGTYIGQIDLKRSDLSTPPMAIAASTYQSVILSVDGAEGFDGYLRATTGPGSSPTVAAEKLVAFDVQIHRARGLYQADGSYQLGYTSSDDEGRVWDHWSYDPTDPALGDYDGNQRYIDLEVLLLPIDERPPDDLRVLWTATDVDDESDEEIELSFDAGCILDPNDFEEDPGHPGQCISRLAGDGQGGDNRGTRHGSTWEPVDDLTNQYDVAFHEEGDTFVATTRVLEDPQSAANRSELRFNLTSASGDNFMVSATLIPSIEQRGYDGPNDETGVFTLWKKTRIEYRRMGDLTIPFNELQLESMLDETFRLAFVDFEFPEPLGPADDYAFVEPEDQGYPGLSDYVSAWDGLGEGQFRHYGEGLYHFLAHTRRYDDKSDADTEEPEVNQTDAYAIADAGRLLLSNETYDEGYLVDNGYLILLKTTDGYPIGFQISGNVDNVVLVTPIEYLTPGGASVFTLDLEQDGLTLDQSYYHILEGGIIGATHASVPRIPACLTFLEVIENLTDGQEPAFSNQVYQTIFHEMVHTYGIQHNCGNYATDGVTKCVMTYKNYPILLTENPQNPLRWGIEPEYDLCSQHIVAVRTASGRGSVQ